LTVNRQKNRYANVIAYDHSRVILSKLPASAFVNAHSSSGLSMIASSHAGNTQSLNNNNNNSNNNGNNYDYVGAFSSTAGATGAITAATGNLLNGIELTNGLNNLINTSPPLPPPPPPPPGSLTQASPQSLSNCSDYINANYMDGYRKRNFYVATQGPLPATYADFWRMIWEQQTCTIVMMTKLEERNRLKCDQYWPSKGTEVYDNVMQVTLVDQTELATYTIRTFVISPVNTYAQIQISNNSNNMNFELRREVKHFQFTAWPDHGVPDHPTAFLMFCRRVKNTNPLDSGPIVVHCSAGVGRTGCFIVIDSMLERLGNEKCVDIYGQVTCLRAQRNYMVQTEEQYIFCYDAVLEASQSGHTEIAARNLYQHLQCLLQLATDDPASMLTEMELEYRRLSNIKAPQSKFQSANLPVNKFKNRLVNILPYESTRVCLQPLSEPIAGTDYINANFVDGYRYRKAYIATQAPLAETVDDFWRMLWEHNSTIIVMLTKLREMGREKCAQYWPIERSIRHHYLVVDPVAEYNMNQYILREFKLTDARDGQSRTIRQFQFIEWPEQGVPKSGESIIELIGQVHKTKEQFGQIGPITVHCSAGVGRTGVFITLSIVLERMRYEGIIDVFNTVKMLRTQRPAMVQTEDQYQFCYRAALEYLGTFDNYD
jgi:protein tyrosine phosphatase